jgi:uncharacterized protein (DUF58 family)
MARQIPEGIRITKVGLWFVAFTVVVAAAATNAGNNALYMVLAVMLALLVVSGVVSRQNLQSLEVELLAPGEVFANRPFSVPFAVHNRAWWLPRWLLFFSLGGWRRETVAASGRSRWAAWRKAQGEGPPSGPLLLPYLPRRGTSRGRLETLVPRRGRHLVRHVHLATIFPLGFFRKGLRYPVSLEVLVYPELFPAGNAEVLADPRNGEISSRRAGWGHDLHALRPFRPGDDPRAIHWKRSARTGSLVAMEREAEESRHLLIVLDNGVGVPADEATAARFERLVSEAATAAVEHLDRGFEVALVTRSGMLSAGSGPRHRRTLLEELALIEPVEPSANALVPEVGGHVLRLGGSGGVAA